MNLAGALDPAEIRARRALLDALTGLGPHRQAVILVGAQAIYLHVGAAREALSAFTIDADLALNPTLLQDTPALQVALINAGFSRRAQPGLWFTRDGVEVDLLVPASIAGKGRRGVDLGSVHDRLSAMRVAGLEAVLVDHAPRSIVAFDPNDPREFTISVAGPAALLVAKLHKIGERAAGPEDRRKNKDAVDLFLLLRETDSRSLAAMLQQLQENPISTHAVEIALSYLHVLFATQAGTGIPLLRAAVAGI